MAQAQSTHITYVRFKVQDCIQNNDGSVTLVFPVRVLSEQERDIISGLYPNLSEQAYGLLEKETVLSSIVKG